MPPFAFPGGPTNRAGTRAAMPALVRGEDAMRIRRIAGVATVHGDEVTSARRAMTVIAGTVDTSAIRCYLSVVVTLSTRWA